jgi:hypothetical protein
MLNPHAQWQKNGIFARMPHVNLLDLVFAKAVGAYVVNVHNDSYDFRCFPSMGDYIEGSKLAMTKIFTFEPLENPLNIFNEVFVK